MKLCYFSALAMAAFLTVSTAARTTVLGVVVGANRVHLNTTVVTAGATVYDGDLYSTETRGALVLKGGTAMLQLAEESTLTMRTRQGRAPGMEAELSRGTLAFGTSGVSNLEITALEAHLCPATEARTFGRVRVVSPKELIIDARLGALQFSYREETERIAEGKSYRVILDPPKPTAPKQWPKGFKIVIIGEGAAIAALGIHELLESESPDRP